MERKDITMEQLNNIAREQLNIFRKNLALYKSYRRNGELEKKAHYTYHQPFFWVTKRYASDDMTYNELCFLIALDSYDRAYVCYEDGEGDEGFEWVPLEDFVDYTAPEQIYDYISNDNLELYVKQDLKEFEREFEEVQAVRQADAPVVSKEPHRSQQKSKEQITLEEAKERAQKLNAVLHLQMNSKPIEGTIIETYLRRERKILNFFAPDVRCLPKGTTFVYQGKSMTIYYPCLAAFGKNQKGEVSSLQLTYINAQGKRAVNAEGDKINKYNYGVASGSFVTIQEGKERVFIAEGVETALSIKEASVKGKIVASLGIGNISNYKGPEKEIIICADNDEHKPTSKTYEIIKKAEAHFKSQGKNVFIIKPTHPGDDFNDVLKKEGKAGVQVYVKNYLIAESEMLKRLQAVRKAEGA